jgi:hypothetical protein
MFFKYLWINCTCCFVVVGISFHFIKIKIETQRKLIFDKNQILSKNTTSQKTKLRQQIAKKIITVKAQKTRPFSGRRFFGLYSLADIIFLGLDWPKVFFLWAGSTFRKEAKPIEIAPEKMKAKPIDFALRPLPHVAGDPAKGL